MEGIEEVREEWFRKMSRNRTLRRRMAKLLGEKWDKDKFPPLNRPYDLGINEFKRFLKKTTLNRSDKHKSVLQYKDKARKELAVIYKESLNG